MLNSELVEYVKRLPVGSKIHGTIEKNVLREAVRPFVPPRLTARRKHPFSAPPGIPGRARDLVQDTLRSDGFRTLPFLIQMRLTARLRRRCVAELKSRRPTSRLPSA